MKEKISSELQKNCLTCNCKAFWVIFLCAEGISRGVMMSILNTTLDCTCHEPICWSCSPPSCEVDQRPLKITAFLRPPRLEEWTFVT